MQSLQEKNIKCVYSPRELKKIKEKQKTDRIKIQAEIIIIISHIIRISSKPGYGAITEKAIHVDVFFQVGS